MDTYFLSLEHLNLLIASLKLYFGVCFCLAGWLLSLSCKSQHFSGLCPVLLSPQTCYLGAATPRLRFPSVSDLNSHVFSSAFSLELFALYCANWIGPHRFSRHLSLTTYKLYFSFVPWVSVSGITSTQVPKPDSCHFRLSSILRHPVRNQVRWWGGSVLSLSTFSFAVPLSLTWIP